jgi:6-phosphogluconolactonase (cycloisomerase 2 family)
MSHFIIRRNAELAIVSRTGRRRDAFSVIIGVDFGVDLATGRLKPTGSEITVSSPVCVKFHAAGQ